MDILDRLSDLLRSALDEDIAPGARSHHGDPAADPDWRDAWKELDAYMRRVTDPAGTGAGNARGAERTGENRRPSQLPAEVRRAYETLELSPGTSLDETRRRFRQELARYHPDRFADDPEKFAAATAVTRELIAAFRRIRDYHNAA